MTYILILLSSLIGCQKNQMPTNPAPVKTAPAPTATVFHLQENGFLVRFGEQITRSSENLNITFLSVLEDSRCPIGAQCVWAGNAKIRVRVENPEIQASQVELNTDLEPKSTDVGNYRLTLESLSPHPSLKHQIQSSEYVAIFSLKQK